MKRKKMIIGTSSIFVLLIIVLLGGSQYMLNYSLRPENRGKNLESSWQYMFKTYPYLKPWIDSLKQNQALKDTFIYSPDHVKLHAYYVASSRPINPEKPYVPLNKNDAFQKVQKRRVQKKR